MDQLTPDSLIFPVPSAQDALTGLLRRGAQQLLGQAIEAEVAEYIARHEALRDEAGRRQVVRNGHKDEREIQTGIGPALHRRAASRAWIYSRAR